MEGLDVDRNQTSQRRRDIAPMRMLRQLRWFDLQIERTKQAIPKPIQRLLKQVLKSKTGAGWLSGIPTCLHACRINSPEITNGS